MQRFSVLIFAFEESLLLRGSGWREGQILEFGLNEEIGILCDCCCFGVRERREFESACFRLLLKMK
jgi:hypothetical protein